VKVPSLVAGRVVLVGDAGTVVRPVTGSGAVKGLDDVLALTDALVRNGADVDSAVADYNAERLPVGLGVVELGQRNGMSAEEMEEWMAHVMAGWYAVDEAARSRG
jgi:2-polyprenyl-6-methoxyphenol hydroxylase-like FAD-dependent oxidoreductase